MNVMWHDPRPEEISELLRAGNTAPEPGDDFFATLAASSLAGLAAPAPSRGGRPLAWRRRGWQPP